MDASAVTSTPDDIERAAVEGAGTEAIVTDQRTSIRDFTLVGCTQGMGLGLSAQNVVSRVFDNSPAARTMPIIVVPQAKSGQDIDQPRFYVMAKDQYVPGSQAPAGVSGGTSNYDEDNQVCL